MDSSICQDRPHRLERISDTAHSDGPAIPQSTTSGHCIQAVDWTKFRLSDLPLEILHKIFWQSRELSLIHASRFFHSALPSFVRSARFLCLYAFCSTIPPPKDGYELHELKPHKPPPGPFCTDFFVALSFPAAGLRLPIPEAERKLLQHDVVLSGWWSVAQFGHMNKFLVDVYFQHFDKLIDDLKVITITEEERKPLARLRDLFVRQHQREGLSWDEWQDLKDSKGIKFEYKPSATEDADHWKLELKEQTYTISYLLANDVHWSMPSRGGMRFYDEFKLDADLLFTYSLSTERLYTVAASAYLFYEAKSTWSSKLDAIEDVFLFLTEYARTHEGKEVEQVMKRLLSEKRRHQPARSFFLAHRRHLQRLYGAVVRSGRPEILRKLWINDKTDALNVTLLDAYLEVELKALKETADESSDDIKRHKMIDMVERLLGKNRWHGKLRSSNGA